jgi:uncharacterized damage-inducible protein DinB
MIAAGFVRRMARYNRWQNENLYGAASVLTDEDRKADRGSFFKSIHATLNHLIWADHIWMSRFSKDWSPLEGGIGTPTQVLDDWGALSQKRAIADASIISWADRLTDEDLGGDLSWYSGAMKTDLTKPKWVCITQLFNHQTHHRGQVHAMLTAAGAKPDDTDLPFMPEAYLT